MGKKDHLDERVMEEGEIFDEFDPISSDDEKTVLDRMHELEARGKEYQMLDAISQAERKRFNYNSGLIAVSSDEDFFEEQRRFKKRKTFEKLSRVSLDQRKKRRDRVRRKVKRKRYRHPSDSESCEHALNQRSAYSKNDTNDGIKNSSIDSDEEELIALRLEALKSKTEVKLLCSDELEVIPQPFSKLENIDHLQKNDFDVEEQELRMIALKSAYMKKAETRKIQKERPYSPTDTPTVVSIPNVIGPIESGESNMEISPCPSPILEDAVDHCIDMDIATPDNVSNSPTFYSFDDFSPTAPLKLSLPRSSTCKGTESALKIGQLRRKSHNADTGSPEDEEHALRSYLLANIHPKVTKSLPASPHNPIEGDILLNTQHIDSFSQSNGSLFSISIESNLKKAAKRLKELTEHEKNIIDASLDKIIGNCESPLLKVNLKEAVERIKHKNLSHIVDDVTNSKNESLEVLNKPVNKTPSKSTQKQLDSQETMDELKENIDDFVHKVCQKSEPILENHEIPQFKKVTIIEESIKPVGKAYSFAKLKSPQVTKSVAALNVIEKPTEQCLPVIMKRKLKTKSSIINVPFVLNIPKPNSSLISSTSRPTIEEKARPVKKMIIQLRVSSSDDSDSWDSDSKHNNQEPDSMSVHTDNNIEEKVDQFLQKARAKADAEEMQQSSTETVSKVQTPNVIRLLDFSSQNEYKNLVNKMRQLERLRELQQKKVKRREQIEAVAKKAVHTHNEESTLKSEIPTENVVLQAVKLTTPRKGKKLSKAELFQERFEKFTDSQKTNVLKDSEKSFNDHSTIFLTELCEFINKIDEAVVAKKCQIKLESDVDQLRKRLHVMENQLETQKRHVSQMFPAITETHKSILRSRDEYLKLSKMCQRMGQVVEGDNYQFKSTTKDNIFEKLQFLSTKTKALRMLGKHKVVSENSKTGRKDETSGDYRSVLECLATDNQNQLDGVLCPFEIRGQCSDKECKYIHLSVNSESR